MHHYVVNKFLYDTDRNPDYVQRYIEDPSSYVDWWLRERRAQLMDNESENSGVPDLDEGTRRALVEHDFVSLYRWGAHPFILWTLMLPVLQQKLKDGRLAPPAVPAARRAGGGAAMAYYREHIIEFGRPDFRY